MLMGNSQYGNGKTPESIPGSKFTTRCVLVAYGYHMRLPKWSRVDGTVQLNSGIEIAANLFSHCSVLYLFIHT